MTTSRPSTREVKLILTEELYQQLEALARSKGKTLVDLFIDAVAQEKWFDDRRAEGARILVERSGRAREVLPQAGDAAKK